MLCDEDCRTAVFGKTERTVGWEGNGDPVMMGLLRHWHWRNPQLTDRLCLPSLTHSFTLDFVVGFQYEAEGRGFQPRLCARLGKFGLTLHPEKTRLIRFGRFAKHDAKRLDGQRKPATFSFLGFAHFCGVNRNGKFQVERRTMSKRLTAKLKSVKAELRKRMHHDLVEQGRWLQAVVRGYFRYHAIPGNWNALGRFRTQIARLWFRSLRRRSQNSTLTWSRMSAIAARWLPPARILHPYPEQRLHAIIRGRSPVR